MVGAPETDTPIEAAEVALIGDDPTRLPYLVALAPRQRGLSVQPSLAAKVALAAVAPLGPVSVVPAVAIGEAVTGDAVTGDATRPARVRTADEAWPESTDWTAKRFYAPV